MITNFEKYNKLEIGDYVYCENNDPSAPIEFNDYIRNNIGVYIEYDETDEVDFRYVIKYDKPPKSFLHYQNGDNFYCGRNEIKHFSKNKEELEILKNATKYNL